MTRAIKDLGVDFPVFPARVALFAKGLKVLSEKLGHSIILLSEVKPDSRSNAPSSSAKATSPLCCSP